jgi:3-keto-disaccharide hydrolase
MTPRIPTFAFVLFAATATAAIAADSSPTTGRWFSLFNGKNLDGWTVKIARHPVGDNFGDTFRVEDGMIKVSYDRYTVFNQQFGHLYTDSPYSHYILRLEYLFTGHGMADAPEWAGLNSGVMIHSQSPLSMTLEQLWPVSFEGQFLAAGNKVRPQTANVCTPGTNVEINGRLTTDHIIEATGPIFPLDVWVKFEAEVHGYDEIIYRVNGAEVLRYQHPQLDPRDPDARRLLDRGATLEVRFGHIALQAEGQPVWFRNIEIMPLEDPTAKPGAP